MVSVTERAVEALHEMQEKDEDGKAFRVVFKGFG